MKMKTYKALSKRVKITGKGKVLTRTCGQDHFNGRERGNTTRNKRQDSEISDKYRKTVEALLPYKN